MRRTKDGERTAIPKADCVSMLAIAERLSWDTKASPGEATDALAEGLRSEDSFMGQIPVYDCSGPGLARVLNSARRSDVLDSLFRDKWWESPDLPSLRASYPYGIMHQHVGDLLVEVAGDIGVGSGNEAWSRNTRMLLALKHKDFDKTMSPAQWDELNPPQPQVLRHAMDAAQRSLAAARKKIEGDPKVGESEPPTTDSPDYLDPNHQRYSAKLAAAVHAWRAIENPGGKHPKQALTDWLTKNAGRFNLTNKSGEPNKEGIEDCAKVANWKPGGGAPKTPGK